MNYHKEDKVGWWIAGGAGAIIIGFLVSLMLYGAGTLVYMRSDNPSLLLFAPIGPALIVLGIVSVVVGLRQGFKHAKPSTGKEAIRQLSEVVVVSRFAEVPGIGIWFSDFDTLEDPKTRFLVQLETEQGEIREYHCAIEVLMSVGEGMRGRAVVQGNWLTQFVPQAGSIARNDLDRQLLPPIDHESPP